MWKTLVIAIVVIAVVVALYEGVCHALKIRKFRDSINFSTCGSKRAYPFTFTEKKEQFGGFHFYKIKFGKLFDSQWVKTSDPKEIKFLDNAYTKN